MTIYTVASLIERLSAFPSDSLIVIQTGIEDDLEYKPLACHPKEDEYYYCPGYEQGGPVQMFIDEQETIDTRKIKPCVVLSPIF